MNEMKTFDARQLINNSILNPYNFKERWPNTSYSYDPEKDEQEKEEIDPEIDFFLITLNSSQPQKYIIDEYATLNIERDEYWRRYSLKHKHE